MSRPVFKRQTEVPIYHAALLFCLADTMDETKAVLEKHHVGCEFEQNTNCSGRVSFDGQQRFAIIFERGLDHRTIGHECFHLTVVILRYYAVKLDPWDTHEAHAYLCGWLTEWVYRMLKLAGERVK